MVIFVCQLRHSREDFHYHYWNKFSLIVFLLVLHSNQLQASAFAPHHQQVSLRSLSHKMITSLGATTATRETIRNPKEAQAVIFDIDGTLADSWKLGFDATQDVLKNNNIPLITEELYHQCTKYSTPERLARHAGLLPERDGQTFLEKGQALAQEFDELYVGLVSTKTAGFYDGIKELILSLPYSDKADELSPVDSGRGFKIAALTNACVAYAHAVLRVNCPVYATKTTSIQDPSGGDDCLYVRFQSIHGADTVPKPKPFPDGLLKCSEEISISPQDCVYVGDSPSDAVAAKKAGMLAIGVTWGSYSTESVMSAPFDFVCNSIDELKQLMPP